MSSVGGGSLDDGDLDPTQMQGFFTDEGAFVQIMPDGQQFVYMPDGQMGYLNLDGTFNPIQADFAATDAELMGGTGAAGQQQQGGGGGGGGTTQQQQQQQQQFFNNNQQQQQQGGVSPDPNHPAVIQDTLANVSNNANLSWRGGGGGGNNGGFAAAPSQASTVGATAAATSGIQQQQFGGAPSAMPAANNFNTYNATGATQPQNQQGVSKVGGGGGDGATRDNNNNNENNNNTSAASNLAPLFEDEMRFGYWPNLIIEIFTSTGFKCYFCYLLWSVAVLTFFVGINWMFGALARVYHPPVEENADWQTMGFLGILVVVSMFIATALTLITTMIKEMWRLQRLDTTFWGVTVAWSAGWEGTPPWPFYAFLLVATTVLPFLWSLGVTADSDRSGIYFAQFFCYLSIVVAFVVVAIVYAWYYFLSIKAKYETYMAHADDPMDDEDDTDPRIILRRQQEEQTEMETMQQMRMAREQERLALAAINNPAGSSSAFQFQQNQNQSQQNNNSNNGVGQQQFQQQQMQQQQQQQQQHQQQQQQQQPTVNPDSESEMAMRRAVRPWYRSPGYLMEFGLDQRTIKWSVFTLVFGLVGVIVVGTIVATQGTTPSLAAAWVVALIAFVCILAAMVVLRNRGKRISIYSNIFFMLLFFVLVMVGCGSGQHPGTYALFLVPLFLIQGMMLRKREYQLRPHEVEQAFGGKVEEVQPVHDMYMVGSGRRTLAALLSYCFNVKNIFGVRHPAVLAADRELRRQRASLHMDLRVLFHFWFCFWLMLCAVSSFADTLPWPAIGVSMSFASASSSSSSSSESANGIVTLQGTAFPICQYTAGTNASFSMYDLSLMALLAESAGEAFQTDFSTWFRNRSIVIRPNQNAADAFPRTNARQPEFLDFYDTSSKSHAIVVRAAANRGGTLLRNLDMVGDSVALQFASIFAPTVSVWPLDNKRNFVAGIADVKLIASNSNVTGDIDEYMNKIRADKETAVIVGFGFNGVIAVIAASLGNAPVVTFNAPGTSLLSEKYRVNTLEAQNARRHAMHVRTSQSLVGLMDTQDNLGTTHVLSCAGKFSSNFGCDSIPLIAQNVGELCGDEHGRSVVFGT